MQQQQIMSLLVEAAKPETTPEGIQAILEELIRHIPHTSTDANPADAFHPMAAWELRHKKVVLCVVVTNVLCQTYHHDRTLIPTLFPVFAAICGDKPAAGDWVAPIDWSLMDQ